MKSIKKCANCDLCNNQLPLLDDLKKADIMWVGLSSKKVNDINNSIPLSNDTNSGKIIERIENKLVGLTFYKTNLVKCLPLNEKNKLRYPNTEEMDKCIVNLISEIKLVEPKMVFILGKKAYDFVYKYFKNNGINSSNVFYIEHPSYIYVYKRKYVDDYINKIVEIYNSNLYKV